MYPWGLTGKSGVGWELSGLFFVLNSGAGGVYVLRTVWDADGAWVFGVSTVRTRGRRFGSGGGVYATGPASAYAGDFVDRNWRIVRHSGGGAGDVWRKRAFHPSSGRTDRGA